VKFFGCMAKIHPKEVCSTNEAFVTTVFTNLATPESESMLSLSIQTIGFIGSTIDGKLALEKLGKPGRRDLRLSILKNHNGPYW